MMQSHVRVKAVVLLLMTFIELIVPQVSFALTGGPSQPEFRGFQMAGTSDMVNLFSGDFNYNIPLMELPGPNGGYPFNLSYNSNIATEQEAGWVGLGWSMSPGVITRQVRGIPDEFNGNDLMTTVNSMKPNITVGFGGFLNTEVFGLNKKIATPQLSIYYNNYKGVGFTVSPMFGFGNSFGSGMLGRIAGNLSIGLGIDSQTGLNINPSLGIPIASKIGMNLSSQYNIRSGLSGINGSIWRKFGGLTARAGGSELSFSTPSYFPSTGSSTSILSLSGTINLGVGAFGTYPDGSINGFYTEQKLKDKDKRVDKKLFGYLYSQDFLGEEGQVMDINREHDGPVSKDTPNLAMPFATFDIFSVAGQGFSGNFRAYRNDQAIYTDPSQTSDSYGGSLGADVGPPMHYGADLTVNHAESVQGEWQENNELRNQWSKKGKEENDPYEPWYFSMQGESAPIPVTEYTQPLLSPSPYRADLSGTKKDPQLSAQYKTLENDLPLQITSLENDQRIARNTVITSITNDELLDTDQALLSTFKISYFDENGTLKRYDRKYHSDNNRGHHFAGFSILTNEGLRYNYCLPAYTKEHTEVQFSAPKDIIDQKYVDIEVDPEKPEFPKHEYEGTNQFLAQKQIPAYTHAYMLTSIVGQDYIDRNGNGVDQEDDGYWIKFTYQKANGQNEYMWRDPFIKSHFIEGSHVDPKDNIGSFSFGKKELWYLKQAESKSHIVKFITSNRLDAKGASRWDQNDTSNLGVASMRRLDEMQLFTRTGTQETCIRQAKFEYDYSLCGSGERIPNRTLDSLEQGKGKLTLKRVWFEYGGSTRGALNPYEFGYTTNPSYSDYKVDRWGYYKDGTEQGNIEFPYVDQSEPEEEIAAWCLNKITLPSKATLYVDYESDDYAYVQNRKAMFMANVSNPDGSSGLYNLITTPDNLSAPVQFKLKRPISQAEVGESLGQANIVKKYIDINKPLYFKFRINLRYNLFDDVSGYVEIDPTKEMTLQKGSGSDYEYATFYVKSESNYNPFRMRAWQHMRLNQPELAYGSGIEKSYDLTSESSKINFIKSLATPFMNLQQMFNGFDVYADGKGWGLQVDPGHSWIRATSPEGHKLGGGVRVRQITLDDNWDEAKSSIDWTGDHEGKYGQVYVYSTLENGESISSGVASYEPYLGGDENPFREPKLYTQSLPLKSNENLYFEYPINESQYPGAQVGYSKVTVMSLPAAKKLGISVAHLDQMLSQGESGYGTSGKTVYEFYTAKDYPVISMETDKEEKFANLSIPVPLLGFIGEQSLACSQGYITITNDMHGKPYRITTYTQADDGTFATEPATSMEYFYLHKKDFIDGQEISVVDNRFSVNEDGTLSVNTLPDLGDFHLGESSEVIHDVRSFQDRAWAGGGAANVDIIPIFIFVVPIITAYPNASKSSKVLKTAVTNKFIHRSGILYKTVSSDGGSRIVTEHLKWDLISGQPVLSKINNDYDAPIYSYQRPAYWSYPGMSASYENIGLTFSMNTVTGTSESHKYQFTTQVDASLLFKGDELLLYPLGQYASPVAFAYYLGKKGDNHVFETLATISDESYSAMIIRSGRRNLLVTPTLSITALNDPTTVSGQSTVTKSISIPTIYENDPN